MEFQLPVKRIKEVADIAIYKKSGGRKYYLKILGVFTFSLYLNF
jgi:hypothetical protein